MRKGFIIRNIAHAGDFVGTEAKKHRGIVCFGEFCQNRPSANPLFKKNFSPLTSHFSREGKRYAFTLAEVLITLGIIGVVAAVTIPNIINKYKNHVTISRLKKCYNQLSQSALYAIQDTVNYEELLGYSDGSQPGFWYQNFSDKMQITKTCIDKAGCWNNSTKCLNDKTPTYNRENIGIGSNIIIFNTTDNYTYNLDGYSIADTKNLFGVNSKYSSLIIFADINGKNKPNIIGKDIFVFVFSDKGFVPAGHDQTDNVVNNNCNSSGNGYFCLEKIIRDSWEIKY